MSRGSQIRALLKGLVWSVVQPFNTTLPLPPGTMRVTVRQSSMAECFDGISSLEPRLLDVQQRYGPRLVAEI